MATHSSILPGIIPWTEELAGLQSVGLQSRTGLSTHALTNVITGDLSRRRQEGQGHNRSCDNRHSDERDKVRLKATPLALKAWEQAMSQGKKVASEKIQGNRFITRASRKDMALLTHSRLLT